MSKENVTSGTYAKDRLKLLLFSDRVNCSPDTLRRIKNGMTDVVSRYFETDRERVELRLVQSEREDGSGVASYLLANIPILEMNTKSVQ